MSLHVVFGVFCGGLAVLVFLVAWREWAYDQGHKDGFRDGYHEGFTDAQRYSELWWTVAEKEVGEARKQIWKEEERWP